MDDCECVIYVAGSPHLASFLRYGNRFSGDPPCSVGQLGEGHQGRLLRQLPGAVLLGSDISAAPHVLRPKREHLFTTTYYCFRVEILLKRNIVVIDLWNDVARV